MFFTESFTLSTLICDQDDRLTLWGLARLFQDVAGDHSDSLGVGFEGLKPRHKAWVLTHAYYDIQRLPLAGERLTLRTWPKPDNGLIAPRDYQLIDSDGMICASSASNWVVLDMDSRRVSRLRDIILPFEMENDDATRFHKLEKLAMPSEMSLLRHIDVPYSALDHTRHVNNAEYIKWICDSIPEICMSRNGNCSEISEFEINYVRETQYGDPDVSLHCSNSVDGVDLERFYRISNSGGVSVNCRVRLSSSF